ncbi:MAG: ATP synthase F1 subunit epsilon [Bacteroidales bacterium]|nr:ATP synthase F1 subunit epsilon [Bacteroidales bacterium]
MDLEIITPDKKVYKGQVKLVKVPGSKGSFEILNNHAPIISILDKGKVKVIDSNDKTDYYNISGGVVEVKQNNIIILAESIN